MRDLVVATLKVGTGQATALVCAIASAKLLAVIAGPAGVGLFSLIRQIQQTLVALASLGGQNAVVQGVASRQGEDRAHFIATVLRLGIAVALIVAVGTLAFSASIATLVFGADASRSALVRWTAIPVVLGGLLILLRGLLNAEMLIGAVAWVNVYAALGALLMVFPAATAYRAGNEYALILILVGSAGLGLTVAAFHALKQRRLQRHGASRGRFQFASAQGFMKVALPSLMALVIGMGCVLAVRAAIARMHGLALAGQFDAAWSISMTFLLLFLTSLQAYLLPKLSASQTHGEWQDVIDRALRLSLIIAVPTVTSLILLKTVVVRLLYSGEFIDAVALLRWTLIGDYVRVAGWVLATTLVARADMRAYLGCEVIFNLSFAAVALALVPAGIAGAGPAYVGAYSIYLAALAWRIHLHHAIRIRARTLGQWLAGLGIVLLATMLTWTDMTLDWTTIVLIPIAGMFSWSIMSASERRFVLERCHSAVARASR